MKAVYEGKDVFVRLPTGFGKSLCYQVLPFVFDHKLGLIGSGSSSLVLVISPLLSLMVDQVQSLRSRGAKSSIITSGPGIVAELLATDSNFLSDTLLFCAPESLVKNRWREVLKNPSVSSSQNCGSSCGRGTLRLQVVSIAVTYHICISTHAQWPLLAKTSSQASI